MDFSGPDSIDKAIEAGFDLDGTPIPEEMLNTRLPKLSSIKKVINALENCRSSLIYLKES